VFTTVLQKEYPFLINASTSLAQNKIAIDIQCGSQNMLAPNVNQTLKELITYDSFLMKRLVQWFSTFHGLWPPSKDSQHLWLPAHQ